MKPAIVVGGGISGLLAALLLKKKYSEVYLIEKQDHCGGLMASYKNEDGVSFDFGTHFGRDTGHAELDDILYGDLDADQWFTPQILPAGNYFSGELNDKSLFIKAQNLGETDYEKACWEFFNLPFYEEDPKNLDEYYRHQYGNTLTDKIFLPLIDKLFGTSARNLSPQSKDLFGLSRLILFTPEISRELKKSPYFDAKLAFHSFFEGQSGKNNYYPKQGGIGKWVEHLEDKARAAGVKILTQTSVTKVIHNQGQVEKIQINGNQILETDLVLWTTPLFQFLQASETPFEMSSPNLLSVELYNFVFDRKFLTDLYYFVCYESQFHSYRTTLYPNIGGNPQAPYSCTVEVMNHGQLDPDEVQKKIPQELIQMGVLDPQAKISYQKRVSLPRCIPVLTSKFYEETQYLNELAQKKFKNAHFVGKGSGKTFFIHEVLVQTYELVKEIFNESKNQSVQSDFSASVATL